MNQSTNSNVPAGACRRTLWRLGGAVCSVIAGFLIIGVVCAQQTPAPATRAVAPNGRAGRTGRGAIPNLTAAQNTAVTQMNSGLAAPTAALSSARSQLLAASLAWPRDDAAIKARVDAVTAAELALANARADGLARIQASPNKLSAAQVAALPASAGAGGARTGGAPVGAPIPNMTSNQVAQLTQLTGIVQQATPALTAARTAVAAAAYADPRNDAAIRASVDALNLAELALASARADALAAIQTSPNKLAENQLSALIANGGVLTSGGFTEPKPIDFNDHEGYISLFDGVSLKGWDGNPKFWRVENGAIVGESTPQNPSGNTYIACRDVVVKDFTLKFEIKVEGSGGSGLQYRSKTGLPWLTPVPANVTDNVGPVNLNWMMTGPQADYWPTRVYSGQFYSENTPMRIMAWRGQVVEGFGMGPRCLMGNIGDRTALGNVVKMNDWNQYTVIARGGTFIHIINGQLMAVMIDDDPTSSNNQPGIFGIEMEATTKVSARNLWLKKLN